MGNKRNPALSRIAGLGLVAWLLTGQPAAAETKGNLIQRSRILSKSDVGITIRHSQAGTQIAFKQADEHCRSLGKLAVYVTGVQQMANTISTWRCE